MTTPGLLVVGSGPAGVSAAEAFRRHNRQLPVRIVTADPALPYYRPPLSKEYLQGKTDDVELHSQKWFDHRSIELTRECVVSGVDAPARRIVTASGQHFEYEWLILTCGAGPRQFAVPGGHRAMQLRTLSDAARLHAAAESARSAVVIGAGFIGCEAAASLAMRAVSTIVVAPQPVPQGNRLGSGVGRRIAELLADAGASYGGGVHVTGLSEGKVHLDSGVAIDCDLILAATGVEPRSDLAESAGIATKGGRIVVDQCMRTSVENIFAAGDVALAHNRSAGRHLAVEHWQDAIDQGGVAGLSAAGGSATWDSVPGFWTTIGDATLKYCAWGDGHQSSRLVEHKDGGFTVWYESDGATVGVLTLDADDDYTRGEGIVRRGDPAPT